MTGRAFRLSEVESWPQCLEILIEGELGPGSDGVFRDALERAFDVDHRYLVVDLDRCEFIDVVSVKLLVVAQEHLFCRREELLIFGAAGQVRGALEVIGAFDDRVLISLEDGSPAGRDSPAVADPVKVGRRRALGHGRGCVRGSGAGRRIEMSTRSAVHRTVDRRRRPDGAPNSFERLVMEMFLGCEHCGRVVHPLHEDRLENCGECGRPMYVLEPDEARELARERRVAEQFRAGSRLTSARGGRRRSPVGGS